MGGFDIQTAQVVIANERLYLTADRSRIVSEDDPDAAYLFCVPGQQIEAEDVARFELRAKNAEKPADKQAHPQGDKQRGGSR